MIKITPYFELPQKTEILNLYLYLVAKAMPFYPEDIFPDGYFYPDGKKKTDIKSFNRPPRKRTEKYNQLLSDYDIPIGGNTTAQKENDAWLAEKIIRENSVAFHQFLYYESKNHHVNPTRLRTLLTTPVDQDSLKKFPFLNQALEAKPNIKNMLLTHVFRYEVFSKQQAICQFVNLLGVEVCPYCNRLFTTTVVNKEKGLRPQLDHYLNKSEYPFLALSIMNLVPCCGICNHLKGANHKKILYPYTEEMGNAYSFYVDAKSDVTALTGARIIQEDLIISLKPKILNSPFRERIETSIDLFNLDKVYQSHLGYVSNLLFQRYIFSDDMVSEIANNFSDLFRNKNEVREMLLLGELEQRHWGNRPLGKLTHDISKELDELYNKGGTP